MFIKFNEQNRCKQIIESSATASLLSSSCLVSIAAVTTAATAAYDKQVPPTQEDKEEEEGGGAGREQSRAGQIMLQMSSGDSYQITTKKTKRKYLIEADRQNRRKQVVCFQLRSSPSAKATKDKLAPMMMSQSQVETTVSSVKPTKKKGQRRRRGNKIGRERMFLLADLMLLILSLLLFFSSAAIIGSSQALSKPSNQVPTYTTTTTTMTRPISNAIGRQQRQQQLHQITARATSGSKFFEPDHSLSSAVAAALASNQQHPDAPKLIPLSALDRYQEGADLKLFCSASAPSAGGRIQFEWRKNNGEQLFSSSNQDDQQQQQETTATTTNHRHIGGSKLATNGNQRLAAHLHISMMDDSSSMLRISHLEAEDSGNYTCLARNQYGADSSTVRVNVNVRLKWIREPPSELEVRAGKSVQVECDASGEPAPLISWTSLKDRQTIASKVLRFDRIQRNDTGLYECKASAAGYRGSSFVDSGSNHGEQLRKLVKLTVNGK